MAFSALIAAYQEAEDGDDRLRALLPMAGRTLLEHQVRRALRAGASCVVVLVAGMPSALTAALDRLRRDKLLVEIARDPREAAGRLRPEEDVLFVADGLVASHLCFERIAASEPQSVLVVEDIAEHAQFERIDAERRWGGLALTTPETMRETAEMLGDWDLQSTLLRRIVQSGARYLSMTGEAEPTGLARDRLVMAARSASTRAAGHTMLAREPERDESWPERLVYPPIVSVLGPVALDRVVEPFGLRIAAIGLTALAALAFSSGWLWTGLVLLLPSGPIAAIAQSVDRARLRDRDLGWKMKLARAFAQGLAILGLGRFYSGQTGDSGYALAAAAAILLLFLCERERDTLRKLNGEPGWLRSWIASPEAAVCLLPLFAITGQWQWWPLVTAIYAGGSMLVLQSAVLGTARRR